MEKEIEIRRIQEVLLGGNLELFVTSIKIKNS